MHVIEEHGDTVGREKFVSSTRLDLLVVPGLRVERGKAREPALDLIGGHWPKTMAKRDAPLRQVLHDDHHLLLLVAELGEPALRHVQSKCWQLTIGTDLHGERKNRIVAGEVAGEALEPAFQHHHLWRTS